MLKLATSILAADFTNLGRDIKEAEQAGAHLLHIDIMDGKFVENISIGVPIIKSIRRITDMVFDVHLMISNPFKYIEQFAKAGADIINFHLESDGDPMETIKKIRFYGAKPAITISPQTSAWDVLKYLEYVEMALVMSVMPGFGGQELLPEAFEKTRHVHDYVKQHNLSIDIEMDGGITLANARKVIDAGANILVSGSAVFSKGDITGMVRKFYEIFDEYEKQGGIK